MPTAKKILPNGRQVCLRQINKKRGYREKQLKISLTKDSTTINQVCGTTE
jgi:hypothetical protein